MDTLKKKKKETISHPDMTNHNNPLAVANRLFL